MNLFISTEHSSHFAIAIGNKDVLDFKIIKKPYRQSELLLQSIDQLFKKNKKSLNDLKSIFVVQGPGMFSALRIGIATANALAYGLDVPVMGIKLSADLWSIDNQASLNRVWIQIKKNIGGKKYRGFVEPFYDKEPNITKKKNK